MSFLQQIIQATKESNKKYKMERAEYERASNVLYDIAERKIKKCVLQRAKDGYTDATFDVIDDLKLDIAGKWSIPELLFAIIFEDAPPVVSSPSPSQHRPLLRRTHTTLWLTIFSQIALSPW